MLTVDIFCWFKLISGPQATNNLHDICHLAMSWQTETMWMNTQWLHCSPLPCSSSNTVVCHHSVSLQSCFYSGITPWAINRTMATGQHCDDTGKQVNEFSFPCFTLTMDGRSFTAGKIHYKRCCWCATAGGFGWYSPFFLCYKPAPCLLVSYSISYWTQAQLQRTYWRIAKSFMRIWLLCEDLYQICCDSFYRFPKVLQELSGVVC